MPDPIILPPGTALAVIAFLLSLLPAGFFVWLLYLRRRDETLPASLVAGAFVSGIALVVPAFWLEDMAARGWDIFFPATAHYFAGAPLPLLFWQDAALPALGTFLVVAVVEEGLRYGLLKSWLRLARNSVNQIFDGLLIGIAVGVGFATLENTLYFLNLFREGSYDTLVFVFFLRFLVSTLAHISFSGLMGSFLARDTFEFLSGRRYAAAAFFIPWLLHGLFDWLLAVHLGMYAVVVLVPALLQLIYWTRQQSTFVIHRRDGVMLSSGEVQETKESRLLTILRKQKESPWNKQAPWLAYTSKVHEKS